MGSIGRYIFRTTLGAFLLVLVSITALTWITQALPDTDWMTNQGGCALVGGLGFVGALARAHPPATLLVSYVALTAMALTAALGLGYCGGSRGLGIEPAAFLARMANLPGQTQ